MTILLGGLFYLFSQKPEIISRPNTPAGVNKTPSVTPSVVAFSLVVKNCEVVSGDTVISLYEGQTLVLTVTTDTDDELHIHGYDKTAVLQKDTPATVSFTTDLTGRYPIELHGSGLEIDVLEIQPK